MPEVFHESPREFWRPPAIPPEADATPSAATCQRCGSEFIVGSRFCHVCGASRLLRVAAPVQHHWKQLLASLSFLEALEFHSVQRWFGVSTIALGAFLIGIGCVLAAIAVGFIYSVQNLADFQAIQLWRIEWLLGAITAFVAGILLKKSGSSEK